MLRATTKLTLGLLASSAGMVLATYGVIWLRLHGARPSVKVDYAQHMNAEVDPTVQPELERLQEIVTQLGESCVVDPKRGETTWRGADSAGLGEPGFDAYVAPQRERAALVRELWGVLGLHSLRMPAIVEQYPPPGVTPALRRSASSLGSNIASMMSQHAIVAALDGDAAACELSLLSIAHVARLSRDSRTMLGSTVHASVCNQLAAATTQVLSRWPHLISDQGLTQIADAAGELGESFPLDIDGDHVIVLDMLQRHFTDDGRGDGRVTVEGLKFTGLLLQRSPRRGWSSWIDAAEKPVIALQVGSRRDQLEILERVAAIGEPLISKPLHRWTPQDETISVFRDAARDHGERYTWASRATDAMCAAARSLRSAVMARDGLLVVIALERYRRDCGDWPASLEALVPEYLPSVPMDEFSGTPMRYEVRDGVPWVWGVGADLDDDGGVRPATRNKDAWARHGAARGTRQHREAPDGDWILFPAR